MKLYIEGNRKGKSSRMGEKFYEEFKTNFWKKPGKYITIYYFESYI